MPPCAAIRNVLVVDKIHRAGLSARVWRLVEALQVAMAMKAALVVPPPCKCLGGHGPPSCAGALEWWDGYVDVEALERSVAAPAWEATCGGILRRESPWRTDERRPLESNGRALVDDFRAAQRSEGDVWYVKNHRALPALARAAPKPGKRGVTQNSLHAGAFEAV
mmetsp:Transcript_5011/g.16431  ORF Transcript_5011/g.16431 Transcript_5011/m.16431 type:complete len:165 (+) Transcript_5011:51-545(+)